MKKNGASQSIGAQVLATDGSDFTGAVTVYITGDNGSQTVGSVGSGACTHEGNGYHSYAPAQAETNYNHIAWTFKGTGALTATIQVYTIPETGLLAPATAGRTLVVDAAGLADANTVKMGPSGSGTAQTARDIGTSVLLSSGTGTGQLDFTSGVVKANLAQILGTALTETAGLIAAGFKKFFNVADPASTMDELYSVQTVTGNVGGSLAGTVGGVAGNVTGSVASVSGNVGGNVNGDVVGIVGGVTGNVTGSVASVSGNIGGNVNGDVVGTVGGVTGNVTGSVANVTGNIGGNVNGDVVGTVSAVTGSVVGTIGGLATQAKADVNAEVVDALNVDTYAEPGQEAPDATVSLAKKIGYLYKFLRNKKTQTATTLSVYDDAGTTVDQKATISDDTTTYTHGEIGSGP